MIKAARSATPVLEPEEAAHARGLTVLSLVHDTGHTCSAHTHTQGKTKTSSVCDVGKKSSLGFSFLFFFWLSQITQQQHSCSVSGNELCDTGVAGRADRHVSRCCVNMCASASVRQFPYICWLPSSSSCFSSVGFIPPPPPPPPPPELRTASFCCSATTGRPSVVRPSVQIYISKHRRPHLTGPHQRLRGGILAEIYEASSLGFRNMLI